MTMNMSDPNTWMIWGLLFLLGILVGVFLTAGGRKKWKTRYESEIDRRRELEAAHNERVREWETREKEWRERDSLRGAALKSRGPDLDADGVRDDLDRRPADDTRA
jgi:hypothetical protein